MAAAVPFLGVCALTGRVLAVEEAASRRALHRECIRPGQTFTLSYIHSSEQVPVRGVFRLDRDGALVLVETAFAGFGPGLPALKPGDAWRYEEGMIVAAGAGARLPELRLRVSPIARQRLTTPSGREVDLSALVRAGDAVVIAVR